MRHKHKCVVRICWLPSAIQQPPSWPRHSVSSHRKWSARSKASLRHAELWWPSIGPGHVSLLAGWIALRTSFVVVVCPIWIVYELGSLQWCWFPDPPATTPLASQLVGLAGCLALWGCLTGERGCPRPMPERREVPATTPYVLPVLPCQLEEWTEAIETQTGWCLKCSPGPFEDAGRTQPKRGDTHMAHNVDCRASLGRPESFWV